MSCCMIIGGFSQGLFADPLIADSWTASHTAMQDAPSQTIEVSGTITSMEDNMGIPGVSILIKGTAQGTITDADGYYRIAVPSTEAVLVFSAIGFITQEIPVGTQSSIDVVMATDITSLEEVVVVGYGTQKKITVTGAVASIGGSEIVKTQNPNVVNAMTGHLPGVIINNRTGEPGRDEPSIYIRGKSTTGSSEPLIIIDGVQRQNLGMLNPHDIESITVLKDASGAIYGARAANGVLLVTTKRGRPGGPVFNFSYNHGFSQPTRNPKMADSYTFAQVYNEIEVAAGRAPKYSDEELEKFRAGTEPGYTTTDWYDEMTRKLTPQHQTAISVSGGNDAITYYLSLGEMGQEGHFNYGSTKLKRYNFRSNTDVSIGENLKFGLDLSGRLNDAHYPGNPDTRGIYSHLYLYQPNWTLFWPGTDLKRPNRDSESIINWVSDNAGTQDETLKAFESRLHYNLQIPWVKGLSLTGSANYDAAYNFMKRFAVPDYVHYYDDATDTYIEGRSGYGADKAQLTERFDQFSRLTLNSQINYDKSFGKHNVGIMAGYEQMEYDFNTFMASRTDFPSAALPELFAGSTDKSKHNNDGLSEIATRQNYFGRITYDYAEKYLAQFIWRYDGSPNFPSDSRWGFFPGVSLGWRISEEPFMENLSVINNLKIRGSYGKMGNDSIPPFQYVNVYNYTNNYVVGGNDVPGLVQNTVPNPIITWEEATMSNIGFELGLWDSKLEVVFDYFKTERSNILTARQATIPDYTGVTDRLPDENVGIVENKGFELQLTHRNSINKFYYVVSGNFSFARNNVIYANEAPAAEDYQLAKDHPIGAGLYYKAIGIFGTQSEVDNYPSLPGAQPGDIKYEDVNDDGILNVRDQIRADRTATPEIVYGLNLAMGYSNFDLSILFQGQENAMTYFGEYFPVMNYNLGNFTQWRAEDRWTQENTDATQPRGAAENNNNNTQPSTHWIVDAAFLRLKNVELGYTLPSSLSERISIENLRLYVSGNNLLILRDNMKDLGFDPETSDYWFYPQQRTFNIGLNLTF